MSEGSVRGAFHEAVVSLLEKPDEEIIRVWKDNPEGKPQFCVTVRREGDSGVIQTSDAWRGVFVLMPPHARVEWIDRKELESIVTAERARLQEETMPEPEVARVSEYVDAIAKRLRFESGECQVWTDRGGHCHEPARVVYQNLDEHPEHFDAMLCCENHEPLPEDLHRIAAVIL